MKKAIARSMSLFLTLVFAFSLCVSASAVERPVPYASDYIISYNVTCNAKGNGVIKVSFSIGAPRIVDEIGASQIIVEKKYGENVWVPVYVYDTASNPELSTTNDYSHGAYVLYNGEVGATYHAVVTVFSHTDSRTVETLPATCY